MADVPDSDLPVFPFRVNWKTGIVERLEWKTDILPDFLGNEQRRGLRLTPRREFEVTLSLWEADRQFWDLWLHRLVDTECLFPVWHDSVRSSQPVAGGARTVWADTRGLEFKVGSYGLLRGLTPISSERFRVAAVYDDHITTDSDLISNWPKGTRVEPLVRGRLSDQTEVKVITSRVSECKALLQCTRAQPFDVGDDPADSYMGMPVLMEKPNWSEDVTQTYLWSFSESDSGTGRRFRQSDTRRAMSKQAQTRLLHGRVQKRAYREWAYRRQGSLFPLWVPTFAEDLTIARPLVSGGNSLYVRECGMAYTGGPTSGREHVQIEMVDGTRYYRFIGGMALSAHPGEERLLLSAPLPVTVNPANVARISWMTESRLDNDRTELQHVNAADGVSTVTNVFQAFRNEREAPEIISLAIPDAVKSAGSCGPDAPDSDICAFIHPEWFMKFILQTDQVSQYSLPFSGGIYVGMSGPWAGVQPNGGVTLGGFDNFYGTIYEYNDPGTNFLWQGQKLLTVEASSVANAVIITTFFPTPPGHWSCPDYDLPEPCLFCFLDWHLSYIRWDDEAATNLSHGGPTYGTAAGHLVFDEAVPGAS